MPIVHSINSILHTHLDLLFALFAFRLSFYRCCFFVTFSRIFFFVVVFREKMARDRGSKDVVSSAESVNSSGAESDNETEAEYTVEKVVDKRIVGKNKVS